MMIRRMTPADVPQVAAIEAQCFSMPWSEQGFLDSLEREDTVFLVAVIGEADDSSKWHEAFSDESDSSEEETKMSENVANISEVQVDTKTEKRGKVVGYIGMYISCGEGEITNVAVSSEYRKQHIGADLVTAMQNVAADKNLEMIVLEVRASNEPAISLYKGKGFESFGIRKNFYEKPREDALIMIYKKVGK